MRQHSFRATSYDFRETPVRIITRDEKISDTDVILHYASAGRGGEIGLRRVLDCWNSMAVRAAETSRIVHVYTTIPGGSA